MLFYDQDFKNKITNTIIYYSLKKILQLIVRFFFRKIM